MGKQDKRKRASQTHTSPYPPHIRTHRCALKYIPGLDMNIFIPTCCCCCSCQRERERERERDGERRRERRREREEERWRDMERESWPAELGQAPLRHLPAAHGRRHRPRGCPGTRLGSIAGSKGPPAAFESSSGGVAAPPRPTEPGRVQGPIL